MSSFDNREKGFEAKFAHDEQLRFKSIARRNKLLGHWAAGLMGLSGTAVDAYAVEVIKSDFEEAGDDDVLRKVRGDLNAKGIAKTDEEIRAQMDQLLATAVEQVQGEG